MAADAGTIELNFRARLDQLEKDMAGAKAKASQAADDMGDDIHNRIGSKLGSLGATIGKAAVLGIGAAAVGVGVLLKGAFSAAEESRKVGAQTEAVIKSTGGVANVSASQIGSYADKLAALTGIDDEVIASGENMLLTFTNVRNQVGKGNDIFDQGTKAALNMSVALGTDMNSASMLVGKALNDPIAGMTALTRSGIQFTTQQKDQIKAMVAAGDTLGAQKVILKELETQFAGSAEAAASPMARLKVVVGNLQEELGARLLPVVGSVASFLADRLPAAMDRASAAVAPIIEIVSFAVAGFRTAFAEGDVTSDGFVGAMERMGIGARQLVDWVVANWPQIQATISQVLDTVMTVVSGFVDLALTIWNNFGEQIISYVQHAFAAAMDIISGALEMIRGIVDTVTALIHGDWSGVWDGIVEILDGAGRIIVGLIEQMVNIAQTTMSIGLEILSSIVSSAFEGIINFVGSIPGRILDALGDLGDLLWDAGMAVIRGFLNGLKAGFEAVKSWVGGIGGWIASHKGPISVDRRLLVPAGQAIMSGLVSGLQDGRSPLDRELAGITASIGGGALNGTLSVEDGTQRGGGGATVNAVFHEKQDPMLIARELAWRMGA